MYLTVQEYSQTSHIFTRTPSKKNVLNKTYFFREKTSKLCCKIYTYCRIFPVGMPTLSRWNPTWRQSVENGSSLYRSTWQIFCPKTQPLAHLSYKNAFFTTPEGETNIAIRNSSTWNFNTFVPKPSLSRFSKTSFTRH